MTDADLRVQELAAAALVVARRLAEGEAVHPDDAFGALLLSSAQRHKEES